MRKAARIDANHNEVVSILRQVGCTVQSLASQGSGCPDLLVGYQGQNYLLEVKDGDKPPSARKLTPDEARWHQSWGGQVAVAESPEQAVLLVTGRTIERRKD